MNAFSHLKVAALSDIGKKRTNNEDAYGVFPDAGIFCVADGMGGGDDGEIASAAVVRAIEEVSARFAANADFGYAVGDVGEAVSNGLSRASAWICERTRVRRLKGCGSTFVGVMFDSTDPAKALAVHAGDSRLYLLRGRSIRQITRDHSIAELIGEKDESKVNPMFRSVVTNGIGIRPKVDVEFTPFEIAPGDRVLVCSDGLSRIVPDKKILSVSRAAKSPDEAVKSLIAAALDAGGIDNVTVVMVEVGELPAPLPRHDPPPEPVLPSDADTEDESGTVGGSTNDTDATATPSTAVLADEGEPVGEVESPDEPAAVETPKAGDAARAGFSRRIVWAIVALVLLTAVGLGLFFILRGQSAVGEASTVGTASNASPTGAVESQAADSQPKLRDKADGTERGKSPAAALSSTNAVQDAAPEIRPAEKTATAASADAPTVAKAAAAVPVKDSPSSDRERNEFAAACRDQSVLTFVRALRRLAPKDESLVDFDVEAERFQKSAHRLSRSRSVRDAEAAAVDLRVLLLNAEPERSTLAAQRNDPAAAAILKAWGEILAGDPARAAVQAACGRFLKLFAEKSAR